MTLNAAMADEFLVNDIHSQLNATTVNRIVRPDSVEEIQETVRSARSEGRAVSIAGGRHAMGGQQFGAGVGSSRVDLQACKLEYSIVSPK